MSVAPQNNARNRNSFVALKHAVSETNSILEHEGGPGEYYIDDSDRPPVVMFTHRGEAHAVAELAPGGYLQRMRRGHETFAMCAEHVGLIRQH